MKHVCASMKNIPLNETEPMEKFMELCQATSTCGMSVAAVARSIVMNVAGVASLDKTTALTRIESVQCVALRQSCSKAHNR